MGPYRYMALEKIILEFIPPYVDKLNILPGLYRFFRLLIFQQKLPEDSHFLLIHVLSF